MRRLRPGGENRRLVVARQANVIGEIDRARAAYLAAVRTVATAGVLLRDQEGRRQQVERSYRLGETGPAGALTANVERAIVELAPFEALVQQREPLASLEDVLQYSIYDASSLYIRLPGRTLARLDLLREPGTGCRNDWGGRELPCGFVRRDALSGSSCVGHHGERWTFPGTA